MSSDKKIPVRYYTCNCEILSKYCDEYHQEVVVIPVSVLEAYRVSRRNK